MQLPAARRIVELRSFVFKHIFHFCRLVGESAPVECEDRVCLAKSTNRDRGLMALLIRDGSMRTEGEVR